MLRKLPDAKNILARSLFYLSIYQSTQGSDECRENAEEASSLYHEHMGDSASGSTSLTTDDFDNLLVHNYR